MKEYNRKCGNNQCKGYFTNIENGQIERCDSCKLFRDDHEAKIYADRILDLSLDDSRKLDDVKRSFDDLRLGAIYSIEGMIQLIEENKDSLVKFDWDVKDLENKLFIMKKTLESST